MKYVVQHIMAFGLAVLVLLSTIGVSFNRVYCSDKDQYSYVMTLTTMSDACTCTDHVEPKHPCCKTKKKKKCCDKEEQRVQLEDDFQVSLFDFTINKTETITAQSTLSDQHEAVVDVDAVSNTDYPPPLVDEHIFVTIQSFLI